MEDSGEHHEPSLTEGGRAYITIAATNTVIDHLFHVDAIFLSQDLEEIAPRRWSVGNGLTAKPGAGRNPVRADLFRDGFDLLLIEPDQRSDNRQFDGNGRRAHVTQGLGGDLPQRFARGQEAGSLSLRDPLRGAPHKASTEHAAHVAVGVPHEGDLRRPVRKHIQGDRLLKAFPQDLEVVDHFFQRAIIGEWTIVEVDRYDLVPLPQKVEKTDRRIDASAHQHHAFRHFGSITFGMVFRTAERRERFYFVLNSELGCGRLCPASPFPQ